MPLPNAFFPDTRCLYCRMITDRASSHVRRMQCRQQPGSFEKQGQTMGFDQWPGHLDEHCPNTDLATLEWKSDQTRLAVP